MDKGSENRLDRLKRSFSFEGRDRRRQRMKDYWPRKKNNVV